MEQPPSYDSINTVSFSGEEVYRLLALRPSIWQYSADLENVSPEYIVVRHHLQTGHCNCL
jgi:hypothetical protein